MDTRAVCSHTCSQQLRRQCGRICRGRDPSGSWRRSLFASCSASCRFSLTRRAQAILRRSPHRDALPHQVHHMVTCKESTRQRMMRGLARRWTAKMCRAACSAGGTWMEKHCSHVFRAPAAFVDLVCLSPAPTTRTVSSLIPTLPDETCQLSHPQGFTRRTLTRATSLLRRSSAPSCGSGCSIAQRRTG